MSDASTHDPGPGARAGTPAHAEDPATAADGSPIDRIRAELDRAKGTIGEVRAEVSAAVDARRGGPATSVDDAAAKLDELRRSIERDVAALRARAPEAEQVKDQGRRFGKVAAGATATIGVGAVLLKRRGARKQREREAAALREQAAAIARELARLEDPSAEADLEGGRGRGRLIALALLLAGGLAAAVWQRQQRTALELEEELVELEDEPLAGA